MLDETYYENGILRISREVDNDYETHGGSLIFHENGKLAQKGHYHHGVEHGEFIRYNNNGQLVKHEFFEYGKPIGEFRMYIDDKLVSHRFYCSNGVSVEDIIYDMVEDPLNITMEERLIIKLKFGISKFIG